MADPRQVAAEGIDAFNAHDEAGIAAFYAPNAVLEAPGDVRMEGGEAATAYAVAWVRAFPDMHVTIDREVVSGDWVVHEFTFEGTHDAPLMSPGGEIPATHKHVVGRGVAVMRVEGDQIAQENLYFDQVQLMTQLGLMPEMAAAT